MKLQLNFNKLDNYAFFCPVSKIHLTRSNPVAFVDEVTPYITRGLKSKAILDITEETAGQKPVQTEQEIKKSEPVIASPQEEIVTEEVTEESKTETVEEVKEEAPEKTDSEPQKPKRRGKTSKS